MKDDKDVNREGEEPVLGHVHIPVPSSPPPSYQHMISPIVPTGRTQEKL